MPPHLSAQVQGEIRAYLQNIGASEPVSSGVIGLFYKTYHPC